MPYTKTVTEFSSTRRLTYGSGGNNNSSNGEDGKKSVGALGARPYATQSLSCDAAMSPSKQFFAKDDNGNETYVIQFNIGDFDFKDIQISNDDQRLFVKGQHFMGPDDSNNLQRQFKREFRLPEDVDAKSIKASLDEQSRLLTLVGQLDANFNKQPANNFSSGYYEYAPNLGVVRENRNGNSTEFEVYLGQTKDGKVSIEVPNPNTLLIRVSKTDNDSFGESTLELKRQIKLPAGANAQNVDHRVDYSRGVLLVKVPLR